MCVTCNRRIASVWAAMQVRTSYCTPDAIRSVPFDVAAVLREEVRIVPQNVRIRRDAFVAALHYLHIYGRGNANAVPVLSSNVRSRSGPLCDAARSQNYNVRCINYILPILHASAFVGIYHGRPNSAWYV